MSHGRRHVGSRTPYLNLTGSLPGPVLAIDYSDATITSAPSQHPRARETVSIFDLALLSVSPSFCHLSAVDYAVKIRVNPQQTGIDTNVKHSMVRIILSTNRLTYSQQKFEYIRTPSMKSVSYIPYSVARA